MKDAYTSQEIANILDRPVQSITRSARREGWQALPREGRGGGNCWIVASMPERTRLAIAARACPAACSAVNTPSIAAPVAPVSPLTLQGAAKTRAHARAAVVLAARVFTAASKMARTRALDEFVVRYNAGEIAVEPDVRAALPSLCRNSLINWERRAQNQGMASLAGNFGQHRKGAGIIDSQPRVVQAIEGMFNEYPHVSAQLIWEKIQSMKSKGESIKVPSLRRVQAWFANWKDQNPQLALYITAPDKWKSQYRASCGSAYELITRYNQRWEYDGTPSDIMLNDGKRYIIVGVINVYSRELLLLVTERSTGQAVNSLTRRALLEWGKPEEAVTDNGKEFVGYEAQGLFLDLGIMPTILPPFRPELKPAIERAFRSFSHHLLTLCPCYVGHNVATRQEIRERQTFAKRLMDRKDPQEISMGISPEALQEFCDDWCAALYAHRAHSGLKGKTPWQMRQEYTGEIARIEDVRALDVLLTPLATDGGWRPVGKKGVHADGLYDHAALGPHRGTQVQVRVNKADRSHVCIFDENGAFICEAVRMDALKPEKRREVAMATARAQKAALKARAKELAASAKAVDAANAAKDIMDMHKARAAEIEAAAAPAAHTETTHTTPMLDSAARAARLREGVPPRAHEAEVAAARALAVAQQSAQEDLWLPESPKAQVALCDRVLAALNRGEEVSADQADWARTFVGSNTYVGFAMLKGMTAQAVNG